MLESVWTKDSGFHRFSHPGCSKQCMLWSIPQFWELMKLRATQRQFAAELGKASGSCDWSFGQILAVAVFLPVLVNAVQEYLHHKTRARHDILSGQDGVARDVQAKSP